MESQVQKMLSQWKDCDVKLMAGNLILLAMCLDIISLYAVTLYGGAYVIFTAYRAKLSKNEDLTFEQIVDKSVFVAISEEIYDVVARLGHLILDLTVKKGFSVTAAIMLLGLWFMIELLFSLFDGTLVCLLAFNLASNRKKFPQLEEAATKYLNLVVAKIEELEKLIPRHLDAPEKEEGGDNKDGEEKDE